MSKMEQLYSMIMEKVKTGDIDISDIKFNDREDMYSFMKMARDYYQKEGNKQKVFETYDIAGNYIRAAEVEIDIWNDLQKRYEEMDIDSEITDEMEQIVENHHSLGISFKIGHRKSLANDGSSDAQKYWTEAIDMLEKFGFYDSKYFKEAGYLAHQDGYHDRAIINHLSSELNGAGSFVRQELKLPNISSEVRKLAMGAKALTPEEVSVIMNEHITLNHDFGTIYKNAIKNFITRDHIDHPDIDQKKQMRFDQYAEAFDVAGCVEDAITHNILAIENKHAGWNTLTLIKLMKQYFSSDGLAEIETPLESIERSVRDTYELYGFELDDKILKKLKRTAKKYETANSS